MPLCAHSLARMALIDINLKLNNKLWFYFYIRLFYRFANLITISLFMYKFVLFCMKNNLLTGKFNSLSGKTNRLSVKFNSLS